MFAVQSQIERLIGSQIHTGAARAGSARPAENRPPSRDVLLCVLDEVNHGLLLVTEDAEVRYANRVALRDCAPGQPLQCDAQRLRTSCARDREDLLAALAGARRGRRSMLTLRGERGAVAVGVVPVEPGLHDDDIVALLVLGKRAECDPLNLQFFAQMHRLTAAESAVLGGLCEGLRPSQVAQRGGVALSTVRSQIDSIRQKTRARGVHDVVRMVQMLPPVVSVLDGAGLGTAARPHPHPRPQTHPQPHGDAPDSPALRRRTADPARA